MFAEGVFWIDLFELVPDATSLIAVTEMTKSGSQQDAAKIRLGH
jgi:hypothetical protein